MSLTAPGERLRQLVAGKEIVAIVGVLNPLTALLAEQAHLSAIYLSGGGVSAGTFGLPDLGFTSLTEVCYEVNKITARCSLPLLVDGDTGWGGVLNVMRTIESLEKAGAAGVHIEDQQWPKRCGHLEGKQLIETERMVAKLKAATEARKDASFIIMARTDAFASEGLERTIQRCQSYKQAGADMIFAEAIDSLATYKTFVDELAPTPILANITEFGKTPLFSAQELQQVGVKMMLYPFAAFRMMHAAALKTYQIIKKEGTQKSLIGEMQTREALYETIHYQYYEKLAESIEVE